VQSREGSGNRGWSRGGGWSGVACGGKLEGGARGGLPGGVHGGSPCGLHSGVVVRRSEGKSAKQETYEEKKWRHFARGGDTWNHLDSLYMHPDLTSHLNVSE
jgi:hypothetical protein